jgi:drug/metabolite transporter (DMT)-like permease
VALWSGNFVVASGLAQSIHPFSLAFFRWSTAAFIFTPFALKSVKRDWPIIKKHFWFILVVATIGISLFNTLIYFAGRTSTAINLSLIALTFPIFILIISAFVFKEKISGLKLMGILIVLSGVSLIISKGDLLVLLDLEFNVGDPLMLLAAFTFAVHSILLKSKPKALSIISIQYSTFFLGAIVLLPFYVFSSNQQSIFELDKSVLLSILYIASCASIISFVSWNKAIEKIGASNAGLIYFLMPLFSGLLAWVILGEALSWYHLLSAFLIVFGIMISTRKKRV